MEGVIILRRKLIAVTLLVLLIQLTGCDRHNGRYTEELNALSEHMKENQGFSKTISNDRYKLTATVDLSQEQDADRLVYEIFIRKPRTPMKDILMSFSLDPDMSKRLKTSDVFQSNAFNDKPVNFNPGEDMNGISLFRGFILDKELLDKHTLNIFRTLYVKITYSDPDGDKRTDYVKMQAEPSDAVRRYLVNGANKGK